MDIDMSILRMLEREKEISFDVLVEAIEQALLTAYLKSPGAHERARVELDRKSGHVTVMASELDDEGAVVGEFEDTPAGFGRIAATTAKQIMLQRLRDAEDDIRYGEFAGKEGDIVSGIIQQGRNPADVLVDLGKLEAMLPQGERVPGERYEHGTRIKCLVVSVRKGMRGPQVTLSRSHPNLVKKLFALEVPEIADGAVEIAAIAREAGHRTKIAVQTSVAGLNAKGACIGPMGQRVRNVMSELHGEKIDIIDWSDRARRHGGQRPLAGPGDVGGDRRPRRPLGARRRPRLPALAGDRQGGPERPAGRPPDRLAHRHPLRRRAARGLMDLHPADGCFLDGGAEVGVLVLSGSSGRVEADRCRVLADAGATALSVRWTGGPGQPRDVDRVPLEWFEEPLALLHERCERLVVLGTSRGAELALLLATLHEEVDGVCAVSPSHVVWAALGTERPQRSSWTRGGEPLPFVPYDDAWETAPSRPSSSTSTATASSGTPTGCRPRGSRSSRPAPTCCSWRAATTGCGPRPRWPSGCGRPRRRRAGDEGGHPPRRRAPRRAAGGAHGPPASRAGARRHAHRRPRARPPGLAAPPGPPRPRPRHRRRHPVTTITGSRAGPAAR